MKKGDDRLRRLFHSAAQVRNEEEVSVPYGFETRIVALWRAGNLPTGNGIARLVRRVAVVAAFVILISGAASFREFSETREIFEPGTDEFVIADSAIQSEFDR